MPTTSCTSLIPIYLAIPFQRALTTLHLPSGSDLASLLIVSEVNVFQGDPDGQAMEAEKTPGAFVRVTPAEGAKCIRCWRVIKNLGTHPDHPELCDRCLEAIGG